MTDGVGVQVNSMEVFLGEIRVQTFIWSIHTHDNKISVTNRIFSGPDRWQPGHLIDHKWENAMTIDKKSWGIRRDLTISDIMTMEELLSQVFRI